MARNRARSQVKGSESKFDVSYFTHTIPGKLPVENVCSSTLQFCGYRSKTTFQKNFNVDFKGSTGFLDITPLNFLKKISGLPDAKFNTEAIGTNLWSQNLRI